MPLLKPTWDWKAEGFRAQPTARESRPGETVMRVWGGSSSMKGSPKRVGVCFFAGVPPLSRWGAESLFSVFEYGNNCENLTQFFIPERTILWVGEVDAGEAALPLGLHWGTQIFIENPAAQHLVPGLTRRLEDDMRGHRVLGARRPTQRDSKGRLSDA
jgi:hypothetical protein